MENQRVIRVQNHQQEGIDLNKLKIVLLSNWIWLAFIFIVVNAAAYLGVRYTKKLYQSYSVLKLDIKKEASDFGIKTPIVEDQSLNLISGEIEIIQSRLFLNRVLDSADLDVSYYSIGRVLDDELYQNHPFTVRFVAENQNLFNRPIHFKEEDSKQFTLRVGDTGAKTKGKYNQWLVWDGLKLLIQRNDTFAKGDEIGYFFTINSHESLINYMMSNLTAEPLNYNANTVRVAFKDNNPFKANAILNKIDTNYLQYSNEQKNLATKQKIDWISNELVNIERKMEDYENYFENFTLENKTNDLDSDLKNTVDAINRIDSQRFEYTQRIRELDSLIEGIDKGSFYISVGQRTLLPQSVSTNLERLEKLYLDQEKLKLSYNEITFAYREKQKEIDITRQKTLHQLTEMRSELARRLQEHNQRKDQLERAFANIPDKSTQFSKNLRYYKLYEQFYLSLVQSKSEFEITQAGSTPDFKILSPATTSYSPISPNKLMIAGVGFVSSVVLILMLLGALYLLNNKITSVLEIERIGDVPVLGIVPASGYVDKVDFHISNHPRSMVSEAIRTLRTNLDFFNIHANRKIITVSSTVSGEGKSFIAKNLGGVMALSNKRVMLLDLDMRKAKDNIPISLADRSKGISTILIRKNTWQECLIHTSVDNFDYIPSGPHPPNPSELLMNPEFAELLESLKKEYDYVILDTPPVGLVTDGIMAMKLSDITIYIFRANYSKKDFLFNLQRIININKFSNITTLLNALPNREDRGYGYGYYEEPGNGNWVKKIFKG